VQGGMPVVTRSEWISGFALLASICAVGISVWQTFIAEDAATTQLAVVRAYVLSNKFEGYGNATVAPGLPANSGSIILATPQVF
jgi:hypothetical protein